MRCFAITLCLFLLTTQLSAQSSNPDHDVERVQVTDTATSIPLDAPIPLSNRSAATLYDNGPLANSIGTGVGGADESVLQLSLGLIILGYGHQVVFENRLADDFIIPPGESWTIDAITLFSYQTGSTTVSPITRLALQIWDGTPGDPGSSVIFGDLSGSCLTTSSWTGIYRVSENNTGVSSERPIMANTCSIGTTLGAGTYWIDWHSEGDVAFTGPWAPPITITGEFATGNAVRTNDGGLTWYDVDDGAIVGQQGLPFIIDGTRLPVELTAFHALTDQTNVHLTWTTASETNNAGFEVQMMHNAVGTRHAVSLQMPDQAIVVDEWQSIDFVDGHGTTTLPQTYTYRITDLQPGHYAFRLKQIDFDGTTSYSPIAETLVSLPDGVTLLEAYPNPLAPGMNLSTLAFAVPATQQVQIIVYDILGRAVRTIYTGRPEADIRHVVPFQSTGLPEGRYAVRLQGETFSDTVFVTRTR